MNKIIVFLYWNLHEFYYNILLFFYNIYFLYYFIIKLYKYNINFLYSIFSKEYRKLFISNVTNPMIEHILIKVSAHRLNDFELDIYNFYCTQIYSLFNNIKIIKDTIKNFSIYAESSYFNKDKKSYRHFKNINNVYFTLLIKLEKNKIDLVCKIFL
jgi:hypothetical protein